MFGFVYFIIFALSISAHAVPPTNRPPSNVMHGKEVSIEEFPHQVAIVHGSNLWCSGTIVARHSVLTADHCIWDAYYPLVIFAGTAIWNKPGSIHTIKYNITFEKHERKSDVGIIVVHEPFIYDATRQPIKLFAPGEKLPIGTYAVISGWGETENHQISDHLLAVWIPLVDREACSKAYERANSTLAPVVEGQLCAGDVDMDACGGDSGGPLSYDGRQLGIVSTGDKCGLPDRVGIYADVAYYSDWITKHIVE